jgi:Werner syndrome ATP-dependent helicase
MLTYYYLSDIAHSFSLYYRDRTEKWWKAFGTQLKLEGYLGEEAIPRGHGCIVTLSGKGRRWLDGRHALKLTPNRDMQLAEKTQPSSTTTKSHLPPSSQGVLPGSQPPPTSPPASEAGPEFLPTVEQREVYELVEVERIVATPTATPPPKDKAIVKLENLLYQHLLVFRNGLAREVQIAPFLVCSNGLLADLARARPLTLDSMKSVEGVSDVWLQKYGSEFLESIGGFCQCGEVDVPMDTHLAAAAQQSLPAQTTVKERLAKRSQIVNTLTTTVMTSYSLFTQDKLSVEEIMKRRSLAAATVLGHLAKALEAGYFVDYRRAGLTEEMEETITNAIRKEPIYSNISSLRLIKDQLPEEVGYGYINLTVAVLKIKTGYVSPNFPPLTHPPPGHTQQPSTGPASGGGGMPSLQQQASQGKKRKLPYPLNHQERTHKKPKNKTGRFW